MTLNSTQVNRHMKTPRAAAIAGIVFATFTITSQSILWKYLPANPLESAAEVVKHTEALSLAVNFIPFAGIAFLWFIGVVRDRIGDLEDRFFATTFLGSGLLYVAMLFTSGALAMGLLQALNLIPDAVMKGEAYNLTRMQIYQMATTYGTKMAAAFMITTSTISRKTHIIPSTLVLLGFLSAVFLLLSAGSLQWSPMIFPVWVLLVSGRMLFENVSSARRDEDDRSPDDK